LIASPKACAGAIPSYGDLGVLRQTDLQWPLQCFEGILRENDVIIESSFARNCNPQFKAFNLKSSFPLKKFGFFTRFLHFILEKYFFGL
jgi:hypothetical protein